MEAGAGEIAKFGNVGQTQLGNIGLSTFRIPNRKSAVAGTADIRTLGDGELEPWRLEIGTW